MINLDLKLTLQESYFKFLNHYKHYGFESQAAMIQSALEKLKQELEEKELEKSAQLYAEIYQEDQNLQELTEAACADFPE